MTTATAEALSAPQLRRGQMIAIPCSLFDLPFSSETGVFIDTLDGKLEGFVQESQVRQYDDQWRIRGMVDEIAEDHLVALVWAEFIDSGGYISLPLDISIRPWAVPLRAGQ